MLVTIPMALRARLDLNFMDTYRFGCCGRARARAVVGEFAAAMCSCACAEGCDKHSSDPSSPPARGSAQVCDYILHGTR